MITLVEELDRRKELEAIGDVGYISGLVDRRVPDRLSIEHYHQNRPRQGAAAGTDSRRQRRHCASLRPKRSRRRNLERRRSRYLPAI